MLQRINIEYSRNRLCSFINTKMIWVSPCALKDRTASLETITTFQLYVISRPLLSSSAVISIFFYFKVCVFRKEDIVIRMLTCDCFVSDKCSPGGVSNNTLEPCVLCPSGTYQSSSGSRTCSQCSHGTWTTSEGSTSVSDCIGTTRSSYNDVIMTNHVKL